MRPTIRDVAKELNLSITTVSRALDGYSDVAKETRQLVMETARRLGYTPNRAARQLRRRKAETVGYVLPAGAQHFAEPFFTEFIAGLGNELAPRNYDLLVSAVASEEDEREMYRRWAEGGKVDGFILNRLRLKDWRVKFLAKQSIPFATLDYSGEGRYPCIRVDGAKGYVDLVQHIQRNGFRKFAYIGGPSSLVSQTERLDWFRQAIKARKLRLNEKNILSTDLTSSGGYECAVELLSLPDPPDAILCVNDETACGVLHAAHKQGLAIGKDLAVAGFDGVQEARHTEPPLTTLDIPVFDIARQLVDMLLMTIGGEAGKTPVFIKPALLVRPSTGS